MSLTETIIHVSRLYRVPFYHGPTKRFVISIVLISFGLSLAVGAYYLFSIPYAKKIIFEKDVSYVQKSLDTSLTSYKTILQLLADSIVEKNYIDDKKGIEKLFKQIDIGFDNAAGHTIAFKDVSFFNKYHQKITKYKASNDSFDMVCGFKEKLKKSPFITFPYFSKGNDSDSFLNASFYLLMGVINSNKEYIGTLSFLLDMDTWIPSVLEKESKKGFTFAIIDRRHEAMYFVENGASSLKKNYGKRNRFDYSDYFTYSSKKLESSPYTLFYGYPKERIVEELVASLKIPLLMIWSMCLISLILLTSFVRHQKVRQKEEVESHTEQIKHEKLKIESTLGAVNRDYQKLDEIMKAYIISEEEKEKITLYITHSLKTSLQETREFIRVLLEVKEDALDIEVSPFKQKAILRDLHKKLTYTSELCPVYKEESIEIAPILQSAIRYFSKDIIENSLTVTSHLSPSTITVTFDRILFHQILLGLLYLSIKTARPKGKIEINICEKKEDGMKNIAITFKDNGFYFSKKYSEENKEEILPLPLLDSQTIHFIIEKQGGRIYTSYSAERTTYVTLPLLPRASPVPTPLKEEGNVVLFKKN